MQYVNIIKKIILVLIKLFFSWFYSYFICLLPLLADKYADLHIPLWIPLLISITALVYVNWTIWSKGILKKFVMFFVMLLFVGIGANIFADLKGIQSDYCVEDGDCEEGYIYNGRPIDEEYCKELQGVWHVNPKHIDYCKLR